MSDWSAQQYLKFEDERTRPARDLAAQVRPAKAQRIYDLGCGPGNSTDVLRACFPQAEIIGVDSSPDMLRKARERLPDIAFVEADLNHWQPPQPADVLYSNATFQWLPNHLAILERLLRELPKGGVLAVQMPDNLDEPSHSLMRAVAAEEPWAQQLKEAATARGRLPGVGVYYDRLKPHCRRLDIWHTHYQHPLDGAPAIVEWLKGTGLRPFVDALAPEQREAFLARYTARIAESYPPQCDGKSLLRFPRLFMVAVR